MTEITRKDVKSFQIKCLNCDWMEESSDSDNEDFHYAISRAVGHTRPAGLGRKSFPDHVMEIKRTVAWVLDE